MVWLIFWPLPRDWRKFSLYVEGCGGFDRLEALQMLEFYLQSFAVLEQFGDGGNYFSFFLFFIY
jgi:hypothetical protein